MAAFVQPTPAKVTEQKLNIEAVPLKEHEQGAAATVQHFGNDLEKISVDIFHALNENAKNPIHDVQFHPEKHLNEGYYTDCKK